jgi:uncharacterized protein (DUF885 family)
MTRSAALDRFFELYYRQRPVTATFTGVHRHDDRLPDWSPEGLARAVSDMHELRRALDRAGRVADRDVRAFPDEVDLALADAFLEIQIAEHEGRHFYRGNPALWTGEAIFSVIALVTRAFAPLRERLEAARSRLRAIPAFLDQARQTLTASPPAWRDKAILECGAAETLFGQSLPGWALVTGTGTVTREFAADCAIARDAFVRFREWLHTHLPPAPPGHDCAGRDLLSLLLTRGHWCTTPIDDLQAEARHALDEAHDGLATRLRMAGFEAWPAAHAALAAQRPTADDYLPRFERTWRRCHEAALAADLVTWPDRPIRYVPIPSHTRDAAPQLYYLFYRSPAPFDALPVHDYVVTPLDDLSDDERERRLAAANDSTILLNHVVHHGGLGHHVQNAHAYASRSRVGQVAAVDAASRIAMFSGGTVAEGWACYACDLAEEIGLLTPLDQVAQQHTRVRLAARAVADLALHTGEMSHEDTARFYESRGLMPPAAARAEAVKNAMFPGAAVMYWLGTRDIHQLRAAVARREGARFSLKRFHDRFLGHGAIPVPLIARLMIAEDAS